MDIQVTNFLKILKNVFDNKENISLDEPVDWNVLSMHARKQNILPLFFEAASTIDDYVNSSAYAKDANDTLSMVAVQVQRSNSFLDVYEKITMQGIYPIVMKGIVCRQLYGELEDHRPSGDEDILIEVKDFHKVKEILEQENYVCKYLDITESTLAQIQEVSFYNAEEKLLIEVHTNIIGKENDERERMNRFFKTVHRDGQIISLRGIHVKTLKPTESLLFLILHAYKHFQNRGVGIRQVIDILLYYRAYKDKISMEYLQDALKTCEAENFWMDILYIGNRYLGLCDEIPEITCCPEALLQDMIDTGVFGKDGYSDHVAARVNLAAQDDANKQSKLHMLFRAAFPSRKVLMAGHPYLGEKPWLLFVAWIKRWIKFARYAGKDIWKISGEILEKSSGRAKLIKKYKK